MRNDEREPIKDRGEKEHERTRQGNDSVGDGSESRNWI